MFVPPKILVVDDNPMNIAVVEEILVDDFNVRSAASGHEAIEVAREFRPDIVLLDIMMPGLDGYETCRRLRSDDDLRFSKVLLVSAKAMVSERLQGYEAGADDYITKPFVSEELLAKVRVFLRLKFVEELDAFKTNVLKVIGRETKAPLEDVMSSLLKLQEAEAADGKVGKELIARACDSCGRLRSLVELSIELCRMREQQVMPSVTEIDPPKLLRTVTESLGPFAVSRQVEMAVAIDTKKHVHADPGLLIRALRTIVHNAVRFSPSGETVSLAVDVSDDWMTIAVVDRGPGIDEQHLPNVLDGLISPNENEGGTGLSLSIANEIVKLHGGYIDVTSRPGEETRFAVHLPDLAALAARPQREPEPAGSR